MASALRLPPYSWPIKPFDKQHPVRGFFGAPRIASGGRTFHFGLDVPAPGGTAVYAAAAGKVSYGSPADVAANGGIVVVEADGRNFGYWHVSPVIPAGAHVALHGLLGHIATRPGDWGHVHFAESTPGLFHFWLSAASTPAGTLTARTSSRWRRATCEETHAPQTSPSRSPTRSTGSRAA